jgi:hypothetical protein
MQAKKKTCMGSETFSRPCRFLFDMASKQGDSRNFQVVCSDQITPIRSRFSHHASMHACSRHMPACYPCLLTCMTWCQGVLPDT